MSVAIFVALILVSLVLILSIAQERIVFQPPKNFTSADDAGFAERIEYHAADGQRLIGFFIEGPSSGAGALLCFHGNADLAAWQLEWGREAAAKTGHSIFLAEYRGYYGLDGRPTYARSRLDADAAYRAVIAVSRLGPSRISFFGHSLGSGVATELALRSSPRRLLLQAPFTSARAMGRLIIGRPLLFLWTRLSRVHFDNVSAVAGLDVRVSVSHGGRDRIVPLRMGREVYSAARSKGSLLIVPSAGHNDLPGAGGEDYWRWLSAALA